MKKRTRVRSVNEENYFKTREREVRKSFIRICKVPDKCTIHWHDSYTEYKKTKLHAVIFRVIFESSYCWYSGFVYL